MNVAIVLTVSNYSSVGNNLPASKTDGQVINGILEATKKFDKILTINNDESSFETKEILSNFFLELKGSVVEEFFFYYSGHGEFSNGEFYFLLSDFDIKKKNRTSLQNAEVDDLIRTLNPQIVIKVIDACQSGTSYIKENDVLNKYFNETKNGFQKCYFLNSSLSNQASYQDDKLSFFTASFVAALRDHPSVEIRYRDIIDFILDDFQGNLEQTPFFVIQADLTEKFCSFNEDFRTYLTDNNSLKGTKEKEELKKPSLKELVKLNAKDYVDEKGAIQAIEFVKVEFEKIKLEKEIEDLYELSIGFEKDNNIIIGAYTIGKWLKDNPNDFFAKPRFTEEYDEEGNWHEYLSGYDLLIDSSFKAITIGVSSKFPNLKSYQCNVVFLISKKEISFFYSILQYIEEGWDSKTLDVDKIKWTYSIKKIANEISIETGIRGIVSAINDRITTDINSQFGLKNDDNSGEDDDLPF